MELSAPPASATPESAQLVSASLAAGGLTAAQRSQMSCSVHIGNLSPIITEDVLRQIFGCIGAIVDFRPGKGGKYAFIDFASVEAAQTALNLNGTVVGGQSLRVEMAATPKLSANRPAMASASSAPVLAPATALGHVHMMGLGGANALQSMMLAGLPSSLSPGMGVMPPGVEALPPAVLAAMAGNDPSTATAAAAAATSTTTTATNGLPPAVAAAAAALKETQKAQQREQRRQQRGGDSGGSDSELSDDSRDSNEEERRRRRRRDRDRDRRRRARSRSSSSERSDDRRRHHSAYSRDRPRSGRRSPYRDRDREYEHRPHRYDRGGQYGRERDSGRRYASSGWHGGGGPGGRYDREYDSCDRRDRDRSTRTRERSPPRPRWWAPLRAPGHGTATSRPFTPARLRPIFLGRPHRSREPEQNRDRERERDRERRTHGGRGAGRRDAPRDAPQDAPRDAPRDEPRYEPQDEDEPSANGGDAATDRSGDAAIGEAQPQPVVVEPITDHNSNYAAETKDDGHEVDP